MTRPLLGFLVAVFISSCPSLALADTFNVKGGILRVGDIKPSLKGVGLTVFQGRDIKPFDLDILGVLDQQEAPRRLVLVRAKGDLIGRSGGIAAGMSGSPVYVGGRLVGAVGFGWEFGDHRMGLVTPMEEMLKIPPMERGETPGVERLEGPMDEEDGGARDVAPESQDLALYSPLMIGGVSGRFAKRIAGGLSARQILPSGRNDTQLSRGPGFEPGSALGVALAVGDVTVGSIGTVTAVDGDKFLAFGHPFLNRGTVRFFATDASVVGVIPSLQTPFKLGSLGAVVGTVMQDRPQGIYGRVGVFPPFNEYHIHFTDVDSGKSAVRRFRAVTDPFVASSVITPAVAGCVEDLWGRSGQGTGEVRMTIEGGGLKEPWSRTNFFSSPSDLVEAMFKEFDVIHTLLPVNPFRKISPMTVKLDVKVTELPKVLYLERVEVPKDRTFNPGELIGVDVWLRPWRGKPQKRTFNVKIPADAKEPVEVVVRGGGIGEREQESIKMGRRSIDSLDALLREISALEANNEIVVEVLSGREKDREEETRLLSEIKADLTKEGSMRVLKTNYYVDGFLRVPLKMGTKDGEDAGD
ncbi:hypothetical protein Taci_0814 [Thermanaerovibrio acidaminovorans DSM 6589]|uniref:Peptidase S55 domain-containing protein n=1 Tax=Thermanaerovibrio acidaminovorans (strain ATCC 49978 / DSM 6589 / Su883) TaxID=525903 RepID=D1B9U4_THEAS|nr:SpoIVB peptidase S55 domain-containing protein [Thermanaerovibrio acidaminovorans]ACZ19047.1 hypothetical protein Taci_0814 [Thermanaerovibrio acidaminovorans DSM 6589]